MTRFNTPGKPYTEVESDYIKSKINESNFDNLEERREINKLVFLERGITGDLSLNYPGGNLFTKIKKNHKDEYEKIHKEIRPEKLEEKKREKKRRKREVKRIRKKEKEQEERQLKNAKDQWEEVKS